MSVYAMKEIEERVLGTEIGITSWCTRLDLLAVSNNKGLYYMYNIMR